MERVIEQIDDGLEMRVQVEDLLPLVARAERIGNRIVAGLILAAFIRGIGDLTSSDQKWLQSWQNKLLAGGTGAMGSYLVWTSRPNVAAPRPWLSRLLKSGHRRPPA
ncbi:hypothetical protein [Arthrobacter alpinus]|nr:hypothetical protein [Arthrobacter alpinus]